MNATDDNKCRIVVNVNVKLISAADWTRIGSLLNVIKHDKYNNTEL